MQAKLLILVVVQPKSLHKLKPSGNGHYQIQAALGSALVKKGVLTGPPLGWWALYLYHLIPTILVSHMKNKTKCRLASLSTWIKVVYLLLYMRQRRWRGDRQKRCRVTHDPRSPTKVEPRTKPKEQGKKKWKERKRRERERERGKKKQKKKHEERNAILKSLPPPLFAPLRTPSFDPLSNRRVLSSAPVCPQTPPSSGKANKTGENGVLTA